MPEIDSGPVCRVAAHIELLRIRTASQIEDVPDADLWVMDRETQYFDEGKALTDKALYRVRGVSGVRWAMPLYKGIARALASGHPRQTSRHRNRPSPSRAIACRPVSRPSWT